MKLTIGMPSYNNYHEVWFTIQALLTYHRPDLLDCEILVVDNFGDDALRNYIARIGKSMVRYERCNEIKGSAYARNKVFEKAKGDTVLCMDSHVLLEPNFLKDIPITDNLVHGTLKTDIGNYYYDFENVWQSGFWGRWSNERRTIPRESFDIWGMTCELFLTSRKGWLEFNQGFRGWGGEIGRAHV
jgi:glycosyltransferase involved in cell wall biosynthesis